MKVAFCRYILENICFAPHQSPKMSSCVKACSFGSAFIGTLVSSVYLERYKDRQFGKL